jgi:hypothetical protein
VGPGPRDSRPAFGDPQERRAALPAREDAPRVTFPRSVGDLPAFYNHKPSANRTYAFSTRKPLYAFGHGLSYTTFRFVNLRVEPRQIALGGTARVSVDVTNAGSREGDRARRGP